MNEIMERLKSVNSSWDFVGNFYVGYTSSDIIAENDDLQKIVDGEVNGQAIDDYKRIAESLGIKINLTEEEEADIINLDFEYESRVSKEDHQRIVAVAQTELEESNSYVFEKAIEGLINEIQTELNK